MKGILFKSDMHRAIREGTKSQTRRLDHLKEINEHPDRWIYDGLLKDGHYFRIPETIICHLLIKSLYRVGDIVYIKEALTRKRNDKAMPADYITYALDFTPVSKVNPAERYPEFGRPTWIWMKNNLSPLFMPEWAARDFIQITDVRPERLLEITVEDCIAEGVNSRSQYAKLWDSINNPMYCWSDNPWVWRYEFKKVVKDA